MPARPIFHFASMIVPAAILLYVWLALRNAPTYTGNMGSAMAQGLILVFGVGLAAAAGFLLSLIGLFRGERYGWIAALMLPASLALTAWLYWFLKTRGN